LVTNDYKFPRLLQLFVAVHMGYVVVLIDGRGSANRGLAFESHLKCVRARAYVSLAPDVRLRRHVLGCRYRMGTVELADQLQGLAYLERTLGCVDRARVGVSGWSYGGYLALMAIAQHGDVFKVAVGGAPVTTWELYDTGYTEKYMGLPAEQAAAYRAGSVLAHAAAFPAEENRVLIVHGLRDENVHFHHTSRLVAELVRLGKPHQLQMYPNERHGLRHPTANEHFETLLFHFLRNHL
jgi:dipeptidyl-peptidase 9